MLNEKMDEVILVKGWKKGANWSFPRGKINNKEADLDCAIREVYEETGYDIKAAGLVGNEEDAKFIKINMREQEMRLYVFRGVPMDTHFEPRTRKEISKIQWYKLSDLPTQKNRKQQQEGKGEDLAVNANKFYMVAPFLPQLKKWISQQKKLDRIRDSNGRIEASIAMAKDSVPVGDPEVDESTALPPSHDDMKRLLDSLQQSATLAKDNNQPEDFARPTVTSDATWKLKNFLGVSPSQALNPAVQDVVNETSAAGPTNDQKANDLLAFLKSKPVAKPGQVPQTPHEQIIDHPALPQSPAHPHHQPQRFSTLPPAPAFPYPPAQDPQAVVQPTVPVPSPATPHSVAEYLPQPPQVRAIPAPQQPAQLIPRSSHLFQKRPAARPNLNPQAPAPYQRTGDPQFSHYSQAPGSHPPSIPPASKLPPPKLTAQSSALLNLFKSGLPMKAPAANGVAKTSIQRAAIAPEAVDSSSYSTTTAIGPPQTNPNQKPISGTTVSTLGSDQAEVQTPPSDINRMAETALGDGNIASPVPLEKLERAKKAVAVFLPPHVLPSTQSLKTTEIGRPRSEHHDKLLRMFRTPSVPVAEPKKTVTTSLQPPSGLVELSALPSPGHSREPSKADSSSEPKVPKQIQSGSTKIQKRPQGIIKLPNPPVSATVNGPLNVPHFDMLAKASKEAKQAAYKSDNDPSRKQSPVQILARPPSSHATASARSYPPVVQTPPPVEQQRPVAPKIQTFVTPTKAPPTPDLKGQEIPAKPFHPQILRRPAQEDPNEPSPIQPLPSPKHNLLANRRSTQPADHKKSLLSLLTKPSPVISPPSAAPASAILPANLISPLSIKPSLQEQMNAAFAQPGSSGKTLSQQRGATLGPTVMSTSKIGNSHAINGEDGRRSGESSGKQTPASKMNPVDHSFLLKYLEGVAKGGR